MVDPTNVSESCDVEYIGADTLGKCGPRIVVIVPARYQKPKLPEEG